MAVITILSGSFCHGDAVSDGVAGNLGFKFIESTVLEETARRYDTPEDRLTRALVGPEPVLSRFTHDRDVHIAHLRLVLAELIQQNDVIIRGCLGLLIPRTIGHVLRVCLIANHDYRVEQGVRETGRSAKDISRAIHEDDKKSFTCTDYLFEKSAYDAELYDVVIPMHDTGVDEAVRQISEFAASAPVQTTERSIREARDFVLSAAVGLALANDGLSAGVHSEDGRVILTVDKPVIRLSRHRERLVEVASAVPGVKEASTRIGTGYKAPSLNPWSNIEGPPKIMLVDDEKEFVHTLSERLQTRDLKSSIAYDGEQALEMIEAEVPDVMVLDLMMPGIDGIEVLRRIKRDHPDVEVIILTGHGSDREKQIAEDLGAFAYLQKPVDVDLLARVMREAYGQPRTSPDDSESTSPDERT